MAATGTRKKKARIAPGFQGEHKASLVRSYRKTILFNERELSLINQYCKKFHIRNKSAYMRGVVISHILQQMDDNYPKLF